MDRLQEIKERHNSSINSFVDGDDIDWLIEKLEYLQKYNLYSDFVNKIDELEKEMHEQILRLQAELIESYEMQLRGMVYGRQLEWVKNRIQELVKS